MVPLVINTILLREIDENKLIKSYANHYYFNQDDVVNDIKIKQNLEELLDWDKTGDNGLALYCGKYESIKRKDWEVLINLIKTKCPKLKANPIPLNKSKEIKTLEELQEKKNKERYTNSNYQLSNIGKPAKSCNYKGKIYKSRLECMYKENITKAELYKYLALTNQLDKNSSLFKQYNK